ncbi:MAG: ferric reductase-like transmembrane domain-containing protein [Roseibium sp.]|uniref:ferric reductase-like transmembrane domain-containing protein n=1 Tax=Roseibium sp. TaxID=1936156 RepID=UPI001B261879|nr:ferric reductase-like transmembrane domain-containing protein [Roseibium sp.]MBO6891687.1 ferric reductase-like transmembrane domain-containing protein [Roseibium sp.]MBO6929661.1 ferric reductase-like transmembrane domain-containing protein [Roseibium sp.]
MRSVLIWATLGIAVLVPLYAAATSPLLAWRQPVYIAAGFAGILALALLLVQPLLAGGFLPGLSGLRGRKVHRWIGGLLIGAVILHVAGLWITSPPDVIDALTFTSPTPFSAFGVVAMWTVFAAGLLAALRRRLNLSLRTWRLAHTVLVLVTVAGTVIHALLIEGSMETVTKVLFCVLVVLATLKTVWDLKVWSSPKRRSAKRAAS